MLQVVLKCNCLKITQALGQNFFFEQKNVFPFHLVGTDKFYFANFRTILNPIQREGNLNINIVYYTPYVTFFILRFQTLFLCFLQKKRFFVKISKNRQKEAPNISKKYNSNFKYIFIFFCKHFWSNARLNMLSYFFFCWPNILQMHPKT